MAEIWTVKSAGVTCAREITGDHVRSWEVMGGHGRSGEIMAESWAVVKSASPVRSRRASGLRSQVERCVCEGVCVAVRRWGPMGCGGGGVRWGVRVGSDGV
jgi:hypothetical protein